MRSSESACPRLLHAPDCQEAPQSAPLLGVQQALNVAKNSGTRLCTPGPWQ
ncbi:DUF6233 domain-containing protein [Streptomyces buecherae]|uniref:DUF6233 domain-containing protein n=1 Tax=Streptomyces buecherae TaxID=2763006 RepID=UPI00364ED01C